MKYFSMFSGIGGFELGIERAYCNQQSSPFLKDREGRNGDSIQTGRNVLPSSGIASFCVGFSEVNSHAVNVYKKHFPEHENYGDATRIVPEELPNFELLCGGFPCQAFSISGKRRGFDDTRGTLFFEIARILKVKNPRMLLLENVKGLLSHDGGRTFKIIISTLVELGYCVEWQVLNSKDFGVPQNRERVFIVGHFGKKCVRAVFPIVGIAAKDLEEITEKAGDAQRVYSLKCARTLKGESGGQGGKTGLYMQGGRIRRLTPVECERLQGFPDGWTEGLSDSQRYKCLGNAVTVNVIERIISEVIR